MPPPTGRVKPSGPPDRGTRGNNTQNEPDRFYTKRRTPVQAVAADPGAPIRGRVAAACHLHRHRWGLPPWPPDAEAAAAAIGRAGPKVLALAVLYARRCEP